MISVSNLGRIILALIVIRSVSNLENDRVSNLYESVCKSYAITNPFKSVSNLERIISHRIEIIGLSNLQQDLIVKMSRESKSL